MHVSREDISSVAEILSIHNTGFGALNKRKLIADPEDIRTLEGILPEVIDTLIHNPEGAYKRIDIPKKSGGMRIIHAPTGEAMMQINEAGNSISLLGWIQKRINAVLSFIPLPNSVCAFRPGIDPYMYLRNTLDQLLICRGGLSYKGITTVGGLYKVDIKDFFNSITEDQVRIVWERSLPLLTKTTYSKEIIDILTLLSCYNGRLNQGPPSSPTIANIVGYLNIDSNLGGLEQTRNIGSDKNPKSLWIRYLRYADDIMVLSFDGAIPSDIPGTINEAVEKSGFKIAEQKTLLQNDSHSYPLLGISLMRERNSIGFQFQIGTARDRDLASELLGYRGEGIESIKGKLGFNNRISLLGRSGYEVEGYMGRYSKRVAHALSVRPHLLRNIS